MLDYAIAIGNLIINNAPYLVGFVLPPLVEVLNRDIKDSQGRYVVSIITCLAVSILLHWNDIAYGSPEQVVYFAGLIFTQSNTVYKLYFEKSYLREVLQSKVGSRNNQPIVVDSPIQ